MWLWVWFMLVQESSDGVCKIRSSTLNLIDLAGSERQKDTLTDGIRLKVCISVLF